MATSAKGAPVWTADTDVIVGTLISSGASDTITIPKDCIGIVVTLVDHSDDEEIYLSPNSTDRNSGICIGGNTDTNNVYFDLDGEPANVFLHNIGSTRTVGYSITRFYQ